MKFIIFIFLLSYLFSQHKYPADSLLKSKNIAISKKIGIFPVALWQRISYNTSLFNCQFYPSCSNYCTESITQYGLIKGGVIATERITRCNPFAYYYHLELKKPFYEKDGRLIDSINQKISKSSKNPLIAGFISSILPGSGRIYAGRFWDGLIGMSSIYLFGTSAYKSIKNQNYVSGTLFSISTIFLYGSEIYGAWRTAKYYQKNNTSKNN